MHRIGTHNYAREPEKKLNNKLIIIIINKVGIIRPILRTNGPWGPTKKKYNIILYFS
jgi:hypothetical protein